MTRDRPALRVRVTHGGGLQPGDHYTQDQLNRYPPEHELEIRVLPDLTYWKRRRYWQILDLAIERCNTPWNTADEAHDVLKVRCGLTKLSIESGREIIRPGSTTELLDGEFDDYFEGAMAWLYQATGVDPETLQREVDGSTTVPGPVEGSLADPASPLASLADEGGDGGGDTAVADERQMVKNNPMSTSSLKQQAIRVLLDIATDPQQDAKVRLELINGAEKNWRDALPGHPNFVNHVFVKAREVVLGKVPIADARKFLFALRDS